ncbi:MAG: permease-like cell division protein FtsX [Candidatus Paceibacterota bacterium]
MFFTNLRRIIQSGFIGFWRNSFVSLSSMLIMVVTIFVVGSLNFVSVLLAETLENVRARVDINVYLVQGADEEGIFAFQERLESLDTVEAVAYTSREQALIDFRASQPEFNEAFDILEENPLNASLNILATETSNYEEIQVFLESDAALDAEGENLVEYSNYNNNRLVIDRLTSIIESTRRAGVYTTAILIVLSILITFNTIRLAIYTSREEISVMRLVGASNTYIRGPFVVSGIIGGVFAGTIVLMAFYPLTLWLGPGAESLFGSINIFDHYVNNFFELALIFVGTGILLGAISSYLAVKRYLTY